MQRKTQKKKDSRRTRMDWTEDHCDFGKRKRQNRFQLYVSVHINSEIINVGVTKVRAHD